MRLARMQGGVEVPEGQRPWAYSLTESIKGIDPGYQKEITNIISGFRELDSGKAIEIAKQISDFFAGLTQGIRENQQSLPEFLKELLGELDRERNKRIN